MRLTNILNYAQGTRPGRIEAYEKLSRIMWTKKARFMNVKIPRPRPEVAAELAKHEPEDMFESDRYEKEVLAATTTDLDWQPTDFSDWLWKNPRKQSQPARLFNWRQLWEHPQAQASALTKTLISRQLPESLSSSIAGIAQSLTDVDNDALQRAVMHAHHWHPDDIRLPKRFNPDQYNMFRFNAEFGIPPDRIVRHLMSNLLRWAAFRHPNCNRILLRDCLLETAFHWRGVPVHFQERRPFHLIGQQPLAPLADNQSVEATSASPLPSLYPLSPLIDLEDTLDYDTSVSNPGLADRDANSAATRCHLAVVPMELPNSWCNFDAPESRPISVDHRAAVGVVNCFGQAVAQARLEFGADKVDDRRLPKPVVTLAICTDGVYFDFVCYQLNTLALDNDDGVKNLAWVDAGNRLVDKRVPPHDMVRCATYTDLDANVYAKLLALYRYGLQ